MQSKKCVEYAIVFFEEEMYKNAGELSVGHFTESGKEILKELFTEWLEKKGEK